jgi:tetratricopeptide (TPR) repeat protein
MLGMIAVQQGRHAEAAPHLRHALAAAPDNVPLRISLGFALANCGELDEARRVAEGTTIPQLERIVAYVDQARGRADEAIARYRQVLAGFPEDAESWKNLGMLLRDQGRLGEAVEAFETALSLREDVDTLLHLDRALAMGERHAERQKLLRAAAKRHPRSAPLFVQLGLAEGAMRAFDEAEHAYQAALDAEPARAGTYLEYGMMLESLNRLDELEALIAAGRGADISGVEIDFLEATLLRRRGRFAEALALADGIGAGINPSRLAQLIGEAADRLGDTDRAFAAFTEMNRLSSIGPAADYARSKDLPGQIERTIEALSPDEVARWPKDAVDAHRPAPVFLVGFPRSGTTLLDTLLMRLPETEVLEEEPLVEALEAKIGGVAGLAGLSDDDVSSLRSEYWQMLDRLRPGRSADGLVIDKFPLHLVRAALIHRIFPDARFIFAERHPCDVVLSCFMARLRLNQLAVQLLTIEDAARLYDVAMRAWSQACSVLPLKVHAVRYERVIDDLEGEMRPLLDYLGRPWDPELLDHRAAAARREHIATASYAQVTEPLYARAVGRWTRYRKHLEPVLPSLAPWAERFGYEM